MTLHHLIEMAAAANASDLMIKANQVPMTKKYDTVRPLSPDLPVLDAATVSRMLLSLMTDRQRHIFDETLEMDLGFTVPGVCRVRCNVYWQKGTMASVCRVVPLRIKTLEELGLPPILGEITKAGNGLVLVTGPTGCGKTTTLAAMLDIINQEDPCNMVTIEDPLEFIHEDKKAYVTQREVGIDTYDFQPALRASLRQAPDVILIGEMRDTTTMGIALQAGETGHLVFSTVHTSSAYETMDRVTNMFPPHEKGHICQRMSNALRAIVAQKLVARDDGEGRVAALEILICTPTVSKAIEDGHFSDLYHLINEGAFWGMQTMNQSLVRYVKAGVISEATAMKHAGVASELKQMLRR
ncbi:MAG: PilT/PilU family type 4a pilus ATPase [Fimbriimonas sp.]|nr:PilT/PilU family type 4a pilus ATPase [Fimbriimonas sp.]